MDKIPAEKRSANMRAIASKNTSPELAMRKLLHAMGYRYRLHRLDLPGKPDVVFPGRKKVIFVHGCFWHQHSCTEGRPPKSNEAYWLPKLERNRIRDRENVLALQADGWHVLTVWECEMKDVDTIKRKVRLFLK